MRIKYIRASTRGRSPALQQDVLVAAGCEKYFANICSGAVPGTEWPGLQAALACMQSEDYPSGVEAGSSGPQHGRSDPAGDSSG